MIDRVLRPLAAVSSIAISACVLAGCAPEPPPAKLHEGMVQVVAPQAQLLWDVSNRGTNAEGDPDGSKLKTADWQTLSAASQAMRDEAGLLASAKAIEVAPPGEKIQNEGEPAASTGAQVQSLIDRDRMGFSKYAAELRDVADALYVASSARDARKLNDAAGRLDGVCEACHVKFWYQQEAAGENRGPA